MDGCSDAGSSSMSEETSMADGEAEVEAISVAVAFFRGVDFVIGEVLVIAVVISLLSPSPSVWKERSPVEVA